MHKKRVPDPVDWQIMGYVERYLDEHMMCPRLDDIAGHVALSVVAVWGRVHWLVDHEYLRQEPTEARTIRPGPKLVRR